MLRRGRRAPAWVYRGLVGRLRSVRTRFAVGVGRATGSLSRRLGRGEGAVIGGRVALALAPDALARLSAGRRVVLVTGTNGKTTTAHLLAAAMRTQDEVAHNDTGANMADGALAALMAHPHAPTAVLEVDELHLPTVAAAVCPAAVVLLNLTRDQLDRSTEVSAVATALRAALAGRPGALVVANCDDPVVAAVAHGLPRVLWVAGGTSWVEDATLCPRCGRPLNRTAHGWSCPGCRLRRPAPDWWADGETLCGAGSATPLSLRLPGDFNRANALTAVATAAALGVPPARAAASMASMSSIAQRYAVVPHGRHQLTLLLAKNPAGWRETLPLTASADGVLLAVNAAVADGRDTSWLWDVPFEQLAGRPTAASGEAVADLGLRLAYAEVDHTTVADPLGALATLPPGEVTVVANYTAFTALWQRLQRRSRP